MIRSSLQMKSITKVIDQNLLLDRVSLQLRPGCIHALLGENGAGKTLFAKIIAGHYKPTSGSILIDGEPRQFSGIREAINEGIFLLDPDGDLIDSFSIAENIFLQKLPRKKPLFFQVDEKRLLNECAALFEKYGVNIDPGGTVGSLNDIDRQLVCVTKAVASGASVIILDEPQMDISENASQAFRQLLKKLTAEGISILLITHEYKFALSIADDVTIVRGGRHVFTNQSVGGMSEAELLAHIAGGDASFQFPKLTPTRKRRILILENVTTKKLKAPLSMQLLNSEILGIAGLSGSGRTALANTIFGLDEICGGVMKLNGTIVERNDPVKSSKNRIGLVSYKNHRGQLFLDYPILDNITISDMSSISRAGVISKDLGKNVALKHIKFFNISLPDIDAPVSILSSGTQQKVLISRWIERETNILILNDVTRNLDSTTRIELYNFMNSYILKGKSIIFISSNIDELIGMSDRIIVLRSGSVAREFSRPEFDKLNIISCASGSAV